MQNYVRLPLKNAYNARDLGGYDCGGNNVTKFGAFVRSDGLERLDDGDINFLKEYGIKTIIDLRSDDELEKAPDPEGLKAFADYVNIPLIPGSATDVTKLTTEPPKGFLADFYVQIVKDGHAAIRAVMQTIANASEGGVLFHCAAGKDRTGIAAAILLGLAGARRSDILANYEVTYTYIKENLAMREATRSYNVPVEYIYSLREYLEPTLDYIYSFGGAEGYLTSIGIDKDVQKKIKERFVINGELIKIITVFSKSGWELIDEASKAWLIGKKSSEELTPFIEQANLECGKCGCEFDPLYKRALELLAFCY